MRKPVRRRAIVAGIVAVMVPALVWPVAAQMTHRLKGSLESPAGRAVAGGSIHAEALVGFRGEQFAGQKEFTVGTGDKGEWTLLGLSSGIWLFAATGPGIVPAAVAKVQ